MSSRPILPRSQRAEVQALGKLHLETSAKAVAMKYGISLVTVYKIWRNVEFRTEHKDDLVASIGELKGEA